ncbi:MAG: S8 family serine peptidase, partial [Stackebrandtia sp.]
VRVWGGGGAAGVTLLLLGGGLGAPGLQLPLMITLAALGFGVAAVLSRSRDCGRVVAAAVAPAAFGPLAFLDGDEFSLTLSSPEIGEWVALATLFTVLLAWLVALLYGFTQRRIVGRPAVAAGAAVIVAAAAFGANAAAQPGFHGEKVLVVLSQQADLSGIDGDRDTRLTEVHNRLRETAESTQADLRAELDDRGLGYRPFYLINAIEVDTGLYSRSWLNGRDDVAKVLLSPQLRPAPDTPAPDAGEKLDGTDPQPNIEQVGAPEAWDEGTGEGITIGISDSGVDGDHPAFADRFRGGDDSWADPVNGTRKPNDPNGHGTHALGLALGANGVGVAPGADWVGCANLPRNAANPPDYLACLQFMLAPYPSGGDPFTDGNPLRAPHVLTNSWGCPAVEGCDGSVLNGAARAFEEAGVFFVVAAGNSGPDCGTAKTPPANAPEAYSVGAVTKNDELANFSSRGPVTIDGEPLAKPEISAPGVDVVSALPGGGYGPNTGTSMAGPHVAGAVAVLWSAEEKLIGDIDATKQLLGETAKPVTKTEDSSDIDGCGGDNAAGAGTVDIGSAVA